MKTVARCGCVYQDGAGDSRTLEQDEIASLLKEQSEENPDKINLEDAIQ
jgi:hypothetical protein